MLLKSIALGAYILAAFLLLAGFFIPNNGYVEFGTALIIVGLIFEFVSKYIDKEHSGE